MKVTVNFNQMLGFESKRSNREAKTYQIGKLQFSSYNVMKNGSLDRNNFVVQMNYNGKMIQGGMKRNVDSVSNWPAMAVKTLMEKGFTFDTHGNCYLKGYKSVKKESYMEVETKFLKVMYSLRNKI